MKMNPLVILAGLAGLALLAGRGSAAVAHIGAQGGKAPSGAVLPPIPPPQPSGGSVNVTSWGQPGTSDLYLPPGPELTALQAKAWKPQADYIRALFAREQAYKKTVVRPAYSVPRLKQIARSAATYFGVPPSWVYGMLQGESNYYPNGIFDGHKNTAENAVKRKTSAYGLGQMLRGRWNGEKGAYVAAGAPSTYEHYLLLDPKQAIWSVAASLGRMMRNRGGGVGRSTPDQVSAVLKAARGIQSPSHQGSLAVGHWWAGQTPGSVGGAKAKVRQVLVYGPTVWTDGMKPGSSWQKTEPAVRPEDWLPPWRAGSLTADEQTVSLNFSLMLEAAGDELRQLNPTLTT